MGPGTSRRLPDHHHWRRDLFVPADGNCQPDLDQGNHTYKAGAEAIINNFMYAQDYPGEGSFRFRTG